MNSDFIEVVKSKNFFILMDLSWHMTRSYHAFKELTYNVGGVPRCTGHVFGTLNTIVNIKKRCPEGIIVLCADGKPLERQEILKEKGLEYKEGRERPDYNIYQDFENIVRMAMMIPGVYFAKHDERESDDLMYSLSKMIARENGDAVVLIYSGDDDMLQAIADRVFVVREMTPKGFDLITNETLTEGDKFVDKYKGCNSRELPVFRAIVGDKSDRLAGIPRFPKQVAAELAKRSNGVLDHVLREVSDSKILNILEENWGVVSTNYKVMKMEERIDFDVVRKDDEEFSEKVMKIIDSYGMESFKKEVEKNKLGK